MDDSVLKFTYCCKEFTEWSEQDIGAWMWLRTHGIQYVGPKMKYCAFCGKKLSQEEK